MLENNETDAAVDYFMKSTENLHVFGFLHVLIERLCLCQRIIPSI